MIEVWTQRDLSRQVKEILLTPPANQFVQGEFNEFALRAQASQLECRGH